MKTQLFGAPNTGGSFADKLKTATDFLSGARGTATAPDVAVEPVTHGLAGAEAPVVEAAPVVDVAPGAAASTGIDAAAPVTTAAGHDADGLAAAARAAAEQSIADPAYAAAVTQNQEFIVRPRVLVQGQAGPIYVDVDIPVPAATSTVTIAPSQAVVLDPATGQAVASTAAAPAATAAAAAPAADVAAPATRGFRDWGLDDLAKLGRGRATTAAPAAAPTVAAGPAAATVAAEAPVATAATGGGWRAQVENLLLQGRGSNAAAEAAAPAATVAAADTPVVAAAGGGDWRSKVEDMLGLAKAPVAGGAAAEVVVDTPAAVVAAGGGWRSKVEDALGLAKAGAAAPAAEVAVEAAPKHGLLDTIRENTAGIGAMLSRTAPEAAPVVDDVAKAVRPGFGAALEAAVQAAKIAK